MGRKVRVAIIGAGTAGISAARQVSKVTSDYVIIEKGDLGTTCAREGCMPSKALLQVANLFHGRGKFLERGILGADQLSINPQRAFASVRSQRDHFVNHVVRSMEDLQHNLIQGEAKFQGPNRIEVSEGEIIEANSIVIATGSSTIRPAETAELEGQVLTADNIFELHNLPRSIAGLGFGPMGFELAQALSRLGARVEVFSRSSLIGGLTDPKVSESALRAISKEFPVHIGRNIDFDHLRKFEKILVTTGRRPNLENLNLESIGWSPKGQRVSINPETLQLGKFRIFVAGDTEASRMVYHEAVDEGKHAGMNSLSRQVKKLRRRVPLKIVFSEPNLAVVGAGYSELKGKNIRIGEASYIDQGRAKILGENEGLLRVYLSAGSHRILGAEMAAPRAEHLAHLLALAVHQKMTAKAFLEMPFYHPVLEEGARTALHDALSS